MRNLFWFYKNAHNLSIWFKQHQKYQKKKNRIKNVLTFSIFPTLFRPILNFFFHLLDFFLYKHVRFVLSIHQFRIPFNLSINISIIYPKHRQVVLYSLVCHVLVQSFQSIELHTWCIKDLNILRVKLQILRIHFFILKIWVNCDFFSGILWWSDVNLHQKSFFLNHIDPYL